LTLTKTPPGFSRQLQSCATRRQLLWAGPKAVSVRRQVAERPEITLCSPGQKALTTSRFIWKVNTHFTMLAPQLIPSALTSSVSSILQFPTEAVRSVRFLRHMTTQLLQEAAQVIPNQQTLINVVSKRVRQLGLGHRPLVETTPRMSLTDIALKEIIAGKLTYESLEGDGA
jgi:DNA-directed RNA polymerase subunit omega